MVLSAMFMSRIQILATIIAIVIVAVRVTHYCINIVPLKSSKILKGIRSKDIANLSREKHYPR